MPHNHKTRPALCAHIRDQLLSIYGPKCAQCGAPEGETYLEINHIYGRDWQASKLSSYQRWLRYFKEAQQGRINLLCPDCNKTYQVRRHETPPGTCPLFEAWLAGDPF